MQDFDKALEQFIEGCQKTFDESHPAVLAAMVEVKLVIRNRNAKYIAIDRVETNKESKKVVTASVHCFVAAKDGHTKGLGSFKQGDVLKAAGFKAPAKGARGNIFDEHKGLGRMGRFGPGYNN